MITKYLRGMCAAGVITLITTWTIAKAAYRGRRLLMERNEGTLRKVNLVASEWFTSCTTWGHHHCLGMDTQVQGNEVLEELTRSGKSVIIVANHPSMAELHPWWAAATGTLKHHLLRVVVKKELRDTPIGWAASKLDDPWWFIDRAGGQESIDEISNRMRQMAESGKPFVAVIYPDATKPTPKKVKQGQKFLHQRACSKDPADRAPQYAQVLSDYNTTAVPRDGGLRAMVLAAEQAGIDVELVFVEVRSPRHIARDGGLFSFVWSIIEQAADMVDQPQEMQIRRLDFSTWADWARNNPIMFRMELIRLFARTNRWIAEISNTIPLGKQIES